MLAGDEETAMDCVEYFIGNPTDVSSKKEKQKYGFEIKEIEMSYNNADEIIK